MKKIPFDHPETEIVTLEGSLFLAQSYKPNELPDLQVVDPVGW